MGVRAGWNVGREGGEETGERENTKSFSAVVEQLHRRNYVASLKYTLTVSLFPLPRIPFLLLVKFLSKSQSESNRIESIFSPFPPSTYSLIQTLQSSYY